MKLTMQVNHRMLLVVLIVFACVGLSQGELSAHEILLDFPQQVEVNERVEIAFTYGHFPDDIDYKHSYFAQLDDVVIKGQGATGYFMGV